MLLGGTDLLGVEHGRGRAQRFREGLCLTSAASKPTTTMSRKSVGLLQITGFCSLFIFWMCFLSKLTARRAARRGAGRIHILTRTWLSLRTRGEHATRASPASPPGHTGRREREVQRDNVARQREKRERGRGTRRRCTRGAQGTEPIGQPTCANAKSARTVAAHPHPPERPDASMPAPESGRVAAAAAAHPAHIAAANSRSARNT